MRAAFLLAMLSVAFLTAGCSSTANSAITPVRSAAKPPVVAACGTATSATLTNVDGVASERIYWDELRGSEAVVDRHQVEGYEPLLSALAEGNPAAVRVADTALVYSHTHIVRLRVSQHGTLLADVGGPYIIAPVGGTLYYRGREVGTYLLSVQDDLGFVGLETRLIGPPVALHVGGNQVPVKGTLTTGPVPIPEHGEVVIRKQHFYAYSFNAKAYPSGNLRISVLRPVVKPSQQSCPRIRANEFARIVHLIWVRFVLDHESIGSFVTFARSHTGALIYVRQDGRPLAGSREAGPTQLPTSGDVRYRGSSYTVASFSAQSAGGTTRIYTLVPTG